MTLLELNLSSFGHKLLDSDNDLLPDGIKPLSEPMLTYQWVLWHSHESNFSDSGNGLVPDGTKPLPKPMLTSHWKF